MKLEHSFVILSLKNLRKEDARIELEEETGSIGGVFLERREFSVDQRLLGLSFVLDMRSRI